ncbi:putative inorganic phosphate cotransporter [Danaus plexippus]|uniref:putative inorganic phosphate cotransporter n=1 Tax=Danaus plexippus TaxID=13037 RepID=UPI002AB29793|nr:putative inorganic phosphate cotransporter [Danaus plexippus]
MASRRASFSNSQTNIGPKMESDKGILSTLQACCIIPKRYIFSIMAMFGILNVFTMRVSLNIAITQMVRHVKTVGGHFDPDACPSDDVEGNRTIVLNPHAVFDWDERTQGHLLSGFYYGYATTQFLGGYLVERYGGKWTIGLGLLSTSIFTLLTPVVLKVGGETWLFILRVLQGMGEGPTMPGLTFMMSRWIPPEERGIHSALIFGGGQMGNVLCPLLSGILLSGGRDWAYVFYFFGSSALIWFVFWIILCYSEPNTHPFISKAELNHLNKVVIRSEHKHCKDTVPWKAILRSPTTWALLVSHVGHDWGLYTMITDLPKYSYDVLKFNITDTGLLSGLPYAAMTLCSFLFGYISDLCIEKGYHSVKTGRILYTTIAAAGPAICIILASYSGCDRNAAMIYFIISMGLMGAYYSGMKINTLDIAPNFAGSLTSLINTSSTFTGIISPFLIGLLTPDSTLVQWRTAFWVCFAMLMSTNLIYCLFTETEQQWWDDVRKFGYPEDWKLGPIVKDEIKNSEEEQLNKYRDKELDSIISK